MFKLIRCKILTEAAKREKFECLGLIRVLGHTIYLRKSYPVAFSRKFQECDHLATVFEFAHLEKVNGDIL